MKDRDTSHMLALHQPKWVFSSGMISHCVFVRTEDDGSHVWMVVDNDSTMPVGSLVYINAAGYSP